MKIAIKNSKIKELAAVFKKLEAAGKKIAKHTADNNNTKGYAIAAEIAGATKIVKILENIDKIQKLEGHMPHDLMNYRNSLYQQINEYGRRKHGAQYWDQYIYSSM